MNHKIIILIIILVIQNFILNAETTWGPKIKLTLINEAGQTSKLFIGVDGNATDGYDDGVEFVFEDTTLKEDIDLPPFGIGTMECRLIRDSLAPVDSYTYVDIRGISTEVDAFMHKYTMFIRWYPTTAFPKVNVRWGKLPAGIDSATFKCFQWIDDDKYINMKEYEEIELDNQAYKDCYINVWYNKTSSINGNSAENNTVTPNPADNYISIANDNYCYYSIFDANGNKIKKSNIKHIKNNSDISINIQMLSQGTYNIKLEKCNGTYKHYPFIKK